MWVRLAVVLVRTATGVPDYFVAVVEDNSARRRAEDALRETEERYRTAFLTGPDAININRLPDGLYIDVNDRFLRMSGGAREEVIGHLRRSTSGATARIGSGCSMRCSAAAVARTSRPSSSCVTAACSPACFPRM